MYGLEKCKDICTKLTEECYELLKQIDRDTEELAAITKFLLERQY